MEEQLRTGLVGAGPWARAIHAPLLADHPGIRFTSVHTRRIEAGRELASPYCAEAYDDFDQFLSTVDAVAFAVPPEVQGELALRAATAGKHVILEKPIAGSLEQAERLADAVEGAGVASLVVLTRRFAAETQEWLAGIGRAGDWTGGSAKWFSGALLGGDYSTSAWRHSGGALADIGPHMFDLLDAALGEITEVLAAKHEAATDLWHVMFGHSGGAVSTASLSMRMPVRPTLWQISVYGEHGYRELSNNNATGADCYTALLDDFLAMIHSGTSEHPCDVRRGLHLQRLLHEVRHRAE
ncbi:Gfo/Idh/MocA family protein [Allokutzneria albata]|uniref:Predicted dehydrogenase n=1 Tax=Allokutzneria albata TaxID=211114 RepID=A0A1H0AHM2_ALLAB|nr:Gfo/Idh/MocA family oxidoreductase [Allokutzneria albata]SDN32851.1 Predicted dehydrogenase [Allokutzneria albata]